MTVTHWIEFITQIFSNLLLTICSYQKLWQKKNVAVILVRLYGLKLKFLLLCKGLAIPWKWCICKKLCPQGILKSCIANKMLIWFSLCKCAVIRQLNHSSTTREQSWTSLETLGLSLIRHQWLYLAQNVIRVIIFIMYLYIVNGLIVIMDYLFADWLSLIKLFTVSWYTWR